MKTYNFKVKRDFKDMTVDKMRKKGETFQITDENRANQLIKSGFVDLVAVTHAQKPEFPKGGQEIKNDEVKLTKSGEPQKKRGCKPKASVTPSTESQPPQG